MRTGVLIVAAMLAAGCSGATVGPADTAETAGSAPAPSAPSTAASTAPSTTRPASAPPAGAPISAVIDWIEAGHPVDAAGYHRVSRDGVSTDLGADIGFTVPAAPAGAARPTSCITDTRLTGGALACLADLSTPPPRPAAVYGEWKGNWVDFDGTTLQVGSAHADPGPFGNGDGPVLPDGAALAFADYRCRSDRAGLFCVNYAHRSGLRLSSAGVEPFGCLHAVPAPDDAGALFRC